MRALQAVALVLGGLAGCAAGGDRSTTRAAAPDAGDAGVDGSAWTRDWSADPPVVLADAPATLFAVSDVHGGYDRAVALLDHAGLAAVSPEGHVTWKGGAAVLVVVGDSIDKGDRSIDTLDLWAALEAAAPAAGGRVVVLLGNHEAEFLADPENTKADALRSEIAARALSPEQFASSQTRWGRFLRRLPVAALVGGWFFSHAGHPPPESPASLAADFRSAVGAEGYGAPLLAGPDSLLEARDWDSASSVAAELSALGARHLVMGHDPNAFGIRGKIRARYGGALVAIDTGMSPAVDDSAGFLLRVDRPGAADEQAFTIDATGRAATLHL